MTFSEQKNNLQHTFLNKLRKEKVPVTIFLINGIKLEGIITWFDSFSVLLKRGNHQQLSISMPSQPFFLLILYLSLTKKRP